MLDAAAPFLFLMEHSPAPPEAVQLMQRLKVVLLKPTQKRKQAALHSFFSKVNRREALVAAARASVVVVGRGSALHAEAWEVAAVTGCYIWSGQWCDMDVLAGERAVGQLTKHGQERRLRMTYRKTLKD